MIRTRTIRWIAGTVAGLTASMLALLAGQSAALASADPPIVRATITIPPAPRAHTIAAGGTPGWQITLIALGAAAVAAGAALILNRALTARRRRRAEPVTHRLPPPAGRAARQHDRTWPAAQKPS